MTTASITLRVLPLSAANLCFPIEGIIGESNVVLGQQIKTAFDFASFYANFGTTLAADPTTFTHNTAQSIHDDPKVQAANLLALRAEPLKAVLNKAIGQRLSTYLQNYSDPDDRFDALQTNNNNSSNYISDLTTALTSIYHQLKGAYANANVGVVTATQTFGPAAPGGTVMVPPTPEGAPATGPATISSQTGWVYRDAPDENEAQFNQSMLALQSQWLATTTAGIALPNLKTIWATTIAGMNLDIKRLQVAYLNTILMSPITGVVTQVRKNLGDHVKAGEPVIRVEDNSSVLLVGTVSYDGVIIVGTEVTVTTTLPGSGSTTLPGLSPDRTITGTVVAISGRRSDSQKWNVAVKCSNEAQVKLPSGASYSVPILPLNYSLDPNATTLAVP